MRKHLKGYMAGFLSAAIIFMTMNVYGAGISQTIEVVLNGINVSIKGEKAANIGDDFVLSNGQAVPFSILYKGTTYLPIRKISELIGEEVSWDGNTNTISLGADDISNRSDNSNDNTEDTNTELNTNLIITDSYYFINTSYGLFIDAITVDKINNLYDTITIYPDVSYNNIVAYILPDDTISVGDNEITDYKYLITRLGELYSFEFIKSVIDAENNSPAESGPINSIDPDLEIEYVQEKLGTELDESNFKLIKLDWERVDDSSINVTCTIENNNKDYDYFCTFKLGVYATDNRLINESKLSYGKFKKGETKSVETTIDIESDDIYLDVFFEIGDNL